MLISDCQFDNCGFFPRYDTGGCIGIHSYGFDQPLNRNVQITGNDFRNADCAIHVMTARDVLIRDNCYHNIRERLRIAADSTRDIHFLDQ